LKPPPDKIIIAPIIFEIRQRNAAAENNVRTSIYEKEDKLVWVQQKFSKWGCGRKPGLRIRQEVVHAFL